MAFEIRGSNALLTGASSGIGRALALELARHGARVALVARREHLLHQLAAEAQALGAPPMVVIPADLSVPGAAHEVAQQALAAMGTVDLLVNNAGMNTGASQWVAGDRDEVRGAFETDSWSPLALVQQLVPRMRERRHGAVVNVTSLAQATTWPGLGNLASTKAALALATETLRLELLHSGVSVLEVIPGPVDTAVQAESALVPGFDRARRRMPLGDPQTLARRSVRALRRGRRRLIYPRPLTLAYHLPAVARWYTSRLVRSLGPALVDDARLVRSGSMGDEPARAAREAWERARAS